MISQKITNEEVSRRVYRLQCKQNIIQHIMNRKLNLFGHICRMKDNRLVKEVMFGTMEGELRRGRPCREWLDDIKEWGGEQWRSNRGFSRFKEPGPPTVRGPRPWS